MSTTKIQIDEIEAEMDYAGWLNFKKKVMGAMLSGKISWEEGVAMRSLIDHALTQTSARSAREEYEEKMREDRSAKDRQ
jgi:hypothetical protein